MSDTYLPFSSENCDLLVPHILMLFEERGHDLGLEIVHEILTPQSQRLGVVTSYVLDSLDDQGTLRLGADVVDQL